MDSTRSKRTHRQGYPSGLGRQWLCDCEAECVTHLGAMSASGQKAKYSERADDFRLTPNRTSLSTNAMSEKCQCTKSLRDSPLKRGPTRGRGNQMRDRR